MQDDFLISVKNLNQDDFQGLKKLLGENSLKIQLMLFIRDNHVKDQNIVINQFYPSNRSAYYAIKHRILEDITAYKIEANKNILIETQEQVNNLRPLLYSEDYTLLEKSLKTLEKKVHDITIYSSAVEVYMCYYLLYYNDPKKRAYYKQKVDDAQLKYTLFSQVELNFYHMVFQTLDIFYYNSLDLKKILDENLKYTYELHEKLNSSVSNFLWLSSKLTVELTPGNFAMRKGIIEEILVLKDLYLNTSLIYRYPNCEFAIECLLNRYYYLSNDKINFLDSLKLLKEKSSIIRSYRMYENVYFYYLFISTKYYLDIKEYDELYDFIYGSLEEIHIEKSSEKIKFYYYYLLALANFYKKKFNEAHSILLQSRDLKNVIEQNNVWILVENLALTVCVQLTYDNPLNFDNDILQLKRVLNNRNLNSTAWKVYIKMLKTFYKQKYKQAEKLADIFNIQKKKEDIGLLLDANFIKTVLLR